MDSDSADAEHQPEYTKSPSQSDEDPEAREPWRATRHLRGKALSCGLLTRLEQQGVRDMKGLQDMKGV